MKRGQKSVVHIAQIVLHARRRFECVHCNIGRKRAVKVVRDAVSFRIVFKFFTAVTVLAFILLLLFFFGFLFLFRRLDVRVDFLLPVLLKTLVLLADIVVILLVFFDFRVPLAFEFCNRFVKIRRRFQVKLFEGVILVPLQFRDFALDVCNFPRVSLFHVCCR